MNVMATERFVILIIASYFVYVLSMNNIWQAVIDTLITNIIKYKPIRFKHFKENRYKSKPDISSCIIVWTLFPKLSLDNVT